MNQNPFRNFILRSIQERGMRSGVPTFIFPDRTISLSGGDVYVANTLIRWLTGTSGFYLALPSNVFGVVIFPDGTSHNLAGGLHETSIGQYKLIYVDGHERLEILTPISEMSKDGAKFTIWVVFRYRVIDPLQALKIDHPVEALIESIGANIALYIRNHTSTYLAESAEENQDSNLPAFVFQKHEQNQSLSKAFIITEMEVKGFAMEDKYAKKIAELQAEIDKNQYEHEIEKERISEERRKELQKWENHFASLKKTHGVSPFSFSIFGLPNKKYSYDLFVVMPFAQTLKPVYDDHIRKVASTTNLSIARADDFFSHNSVMYTVWSAIAQSTIIIADCTGKNPNVFYEIGIAHTIGKPVILITQNQDDVPFDVRHMRYIQYEYTPPGMVKFENTLAATIMDIMKDISDDSNE